MLTGIRQRVRRVMAHATVLLLAATGVIFTSEPAFATNFYCLNGGYLIVYARGTTAGFNTPEAERFADIGEPLSQPKRFLEVGNLDENGLLESNEYDASRIDYSNSINRGVNELLDFLYSRANCHGETIIFGGFSQGAAVIGKMLNQLTGLSGAAIKDRIGYAALYGDPSYLGRYGQADGCVLPWWVKLPTPFCSQNAVTGSLGYRWPYGPEYLRHSRFGSWCDQGDKLCMGMTGLLHWDLGNHGNIYKQRIPESAEYIAGRAIAKRNELNPAEPPSSGEIGAQQPLATTLPAPLPPQPSTPSAISRNDRTMDVFYKDSNGNLVNRGWDVDFGWNYQSWDVDIVGNPIAVARKPEAMDVFWRGSGGSIWNMGWDVDTGWMTPIKRIEDGAVGDPAVISRAPGEMDVFWRSTNNELKNVHWGTNGWENVVTRVSAGNVYSNPTVTSRRYDLMDVFYKGTNTNLVNLGWKATDGWYAPHIRCTNIAENPKAIHRGLNAMSIFYRASNGDLAECGWDGSIGWFGQSWIVPMEGDPAPLARNTTSVSVFYCKADGTLWERWMDSSGWHLQGWNDSANGDPAVVSHSSTTMDVFFREGQTGLANRGFDSCCGWRKTSL